MALDVPFLQAKLANRQVQWLESVDSTMYAASRLAAAGAPSGSVVGAEEQTGGQGRFGRTWCSEKETGLYFTVVLRLPLEPRHVPVVTLALGLAVSDTLRLLAGVPADLRWPNDVMLNGRKCAGILTHFDNGAVLAGIGLNVNQQSFPPDIAPLATSLRIETGREHAREPLLVYLLGAIDSFSRVLTTSGVEPILQMFENSSSYVRGRRVAVDQAEGTITGTTAGLTPGGFLQLTKDSGETVTILAGGVRPLG
ncbi:MAG TPA: biotin--[acetyl-CoA-carboxylase] ligase [Solibacterales bacterium]|nr:biotin--[acetyl-CoA-carboxylase] ligase [Bryobacterales bacterium]